MQIEMVHLLIGAITLAVVVAAAVATWRHHRTASFYLIAAGLLSMAFFATVPGLPLVAIGTGALLAAVGVITASPADDAADLPESSLHLDTKVTPAGHIEQVYPEVEDASEKAE